MPGAVVRTSASALNNVTLPHVLRIADLGWQDALRANPHAREHFRRHSYVGMAAKGSIAGFGARGYLLALEAAAGL